MTRFKLNKQELEPTESAPVTEQNFPPLPAPDPALLQDAPAAAPSEQKAAEVRTSAAAVINLPIPCRQMAWFLNDSRRPEQAQVSRIEVTQIAKPNVYGNECEWNERIVYFVGRCQRLSTEVFATKEELIASLLKD